MILDEQDMALPRPESPRQDWLITYSDLVSLMLTFFVLLISMSSTDPSRVESAVSSLTEKFAKSAISSEAGIVTSQSGTVILDQAYLDSVITTIRGRDNIGEVKVLRSEEGTLMVRLDRDKVFLPRTGVLSPDGLSVINGIARAMQRGNSGITLPMAEIRLVGDAKELTFVAKAGENETPVIIRQASRIARTLTAAQVPSTALTAVLMEGAEPGLVLAFYAIASAVKNSLPGSNPS